MATTADFIRRSALDRSISVEVPPNWFYTAQGGHIVATSPQSRAGLLFKVFAVSARADGFEPQPNVLNSAYRPPAAFIHDALAQYFFRTIRVIGWRADELAGQRCALVIKRSCEAADVVVRFASLEGAQSVGTFKIVNAVPTSAGQWFSIVAGVWGSAEDLRLDIPVLEHAARSLITADNIANIYMDDPVTQIQLLTNNRLFNSGLSDDRLEPKKK